MCLNNVCCHMLIYITPASRALTDFYVQLILNEFIPDIILFCNVGIAVSQHHCQHQDEIKNWDILNLFCEKLYRIVFSVNNILISKTIRHYFCNFYSTSFLALFIIIRQYLSHSCRLSSDS